MVTLNANAWNYFKTKLTERKVQEEIGEAAILRLQETKIGQSSISDAVTYCKQRGWLASFSPAQLRDTGSHSGGVAILVRDKLNIGIQRLGSSTAVLQHRLLAVRLEVPGYGSMAVASTYLEAVSGLSATNRELLAEIAMLQHDCKLPVAVGGDWNMEPRTLQRADFLHRAQMRILAPDIATCVTRTSSRVIDFFVVSRSLAEQIGAPARTLAYYLRPHRPVAFNMALDDEEFVPVLSRPRSIPISWPFGPSVEEEDWTELDELLHQSRVDLPEDPSGQLGALNYVYGHFLKKMEASICRQTDTPVPLTTRRGRAPEILLVPRDQRRREQWKSWHCLQQPLGWLQSVLQQIRAAVDEERLNVLTMLAQELQEPPAEFHSHVALMGLLAHARLLCEASTAVDSAPSNDVVDAIDSLPGQISKALDQEVAPQSGIERDAWRQ